MPLNSLEWAWEALNGKLEPSVRRTRPVKAGVSGESEAHKESRFRPGAIANSSEDAAPARPINFPGRGTINMPLRWSFPLSQNVSAFFIREDFSLRMRNLLVRYYPYFACTVNVDSLAPARSVTGVT